MARISGVDIPRDKQVGISLTYIFGIGRSTASVICEATGIDPTTRVPFGFRLRFARRSRGGSRRIGQEKDRSARRHGALCFVGAP